MRTRWREWQQNEPTVPPKHIGIIRLPNGHELHTPSFAHWISHPEAGTWFSQLTGQEEGTIRGVSMELWEDDGSEEFARAHERAARRVGGPHPPGPSPTFGEGV